MKHLVVGYGQIGKAIKQVLEQNPDNEITTIDMEAVQSYNVDVMHVCFPYSNTFDVAVRAYKDAFKPTLTIIHSTVPVGTSRRLNAVHSPVTGRHPDLFESVMTFTKFFGGERAQEASLIFDNCGVFVEDVPESETTEAGKLWQTLQYGWLIALQKEGYKWMRAVGADPEVAYNMFNNEYNYGYEQMGYKYSLPVLLDMPGPIGGHCVIPNLDLTDSDLADVLKRLNDTY